MRPLLKSILNGICICAVLPSALTAGFGRADAVFHFWAQLIALAPGLPGDYLRGAFYKLTLEECCLECRISFGTFFSHSQARVGKLVYIGSNSTIGRARIGERTQIASGVQVLSGRRQHSRGKDGDIMSADHAAFETVEIGPDCWIGAGAIIAAPIGARTTIGAGAVVVSPIPSGVVAVGNPARVIKIVGQSGS